MIKGIIKNLVICLLIVLISLGIGIGMSSMYETALIEQPDDAAYFRELFGI